MKKLSIYLMILFIVPAILFTGCKEEEKDNSFDVLKTYLVDNDMDITKVLEGWIVAASAVVDTNDYSIPGYYVVDIRSATDFAAGHIKNAVNSTLGNILTTAQNAGTLPILVVCYTGQTASHAVVGLRLSGYTDAKVLMWGMSGWNSTFSGPWNTATAAGNIAVGNANWTIPANITASTMFDYPSFTSTATDGAGILEERVALMLSNGFQGVAAADVLANPADYFVNNYWALTDVEHYGHVAGAYRINPLTIAGDEIANLNPAETIVTYCWTGQTSSMVTAYLNVLGYNAKSLKFGANGMIYPTLESHKFVAPDQGYEFVTE